MSRSLLSAAQLMLHVSSLEPGSETTSQQCYWLPVRQQADYTAARLTHQSLSGQATADDISLIFDTGRHLLQLTSDITCHSIHKQCAWNRVYPFNVRYEQFKQLLTTFLHCVHEKTAPLSMLKNFQN